MDEIVKLKGTGDGVKIYLSSEYRISEITKALHDKLDEYRKFFGDGKCNIYFIGDNISDTDKLRLEAVAKAMLPQASINYGEKRLLKKIEKLLEKEQKNVRKTRKAIHQPKSDKRQTKIGDSGLQNERGAGMKKNFSPFRNGKNSQKFN